MPTKIGGMKTGVLIMVRSEGSTRVLTNLSHGEHAIIGQAVDAAADQRRVDEAASAPLTTTRFDYMFKALRDFYPGAHLDPSSRQAQLSLR